MLILDEIRGFWESCWIVCLNMEWILRRIFLAENSIASFYYSYSLHRNLKPTETMLLMA